MPTTPPLRFLWLVLALCLLAAVAACGEEGGTNPDDDSGTSGEADADGDGSPTGEATEDAGTESDASPDTPTADTPDPDGTEATADGADGDGTFFDPDVPNGDGGGTTTPTGPLGILAMDPDRGPEEGDTPFIVFGYGFTVDTDVLINGHLADDIDFVDDETILARSPANPAGIYDVKVVNAAEEAVLIQGFTYFAELAITDIEPVTGPERGGVPMTVSGAGFTDDALVSVGGRLGIDVRVLSAEQIEFILPPGVAGPADVRVTNENGTEVLAGGFEYYAEPDIRQVYPGAGPTAGDFEVELRGHGFGRDDTVHFGPSPSPDIDFLNAETLIVDVPPGAPGATDVTIVGPRGGDTEVGGFYYVAEPDGELVVAAVRPATGGADGGYAVTVAGPGVGDAERVRFGSTDAEILEAFDGAVTVTVPAGTGEVDVHVETADAESTLTNGYRYLPELRLDEIEPAEGDVAGGDTVTLRGAGFVDGIEVRFGPVAARGVRVSGFGELTATTPPGSLGTVDVTLRDASRTATLADGFTYTEEAEVSSVTPTRGAIAGNTFVVVRGRGFHGDVQVFFGDYEAPVVAVVDAATLEVRTPEVPEPERVAIRVLVDGVELRTGKNFVYYDPFSPAGGWWGDPIDGSVNVTVLDSGSGDRIESAFVTLGLRADDRRWTCTTNAIGQCTISGPGLRGEQTVSASALNYSAVTVNHVDAENVMIFLSSTVPPTPGAPPGGEAPIISGLLSGLDKITDPADDEVLVGVIRTTTPGVGAQNPPGTGFAQVVWTGGDDPIPYEMFSRMGELAVVALCGLFNETTGEFTPLYMGVRRGLAVRGVGTYTVDLDCDIHLNQTLTVKFTNPPIAPGGPDINQAIPYLDFGGEGAADLLRTAEGRTDVVSNDHFAPLDEPQLAGVDYEIIGQTVPNDGGLPFAVAFGRDITNPDARITLPAMLPPADLRYPAPGGVAVERRFEWELATRERPDFYYAYVQNMAQEITYWEVWLPGDERGFNLPFFPPDEDSVALPSGPLILIVLSIKAFTFDYDAFEFNDFGSWNWRSYSANGWVWINP